MKITKERTSAVSNHDLVQWGQSGKVEPYVSGTFAGIVENCREITVLENEVETTYNICTLVTQGAAIASLSGTAPQNGSSAYINGSSVSSTGTTKIGLIVAKAWPNSGDYADGDLVNVVIK